MSVITKKIIAGRNSLAPQLPQVYVSLVFSTNSKKEIIADVTFLNNGNRSMKLGWNRIAYVAYGQTIDSERGGSVDLAAGGGHSHVGSSESKSFIITPQKPNPKNSNPSDIYAYDPKDISLEIDFEY